MKDNHENTPPSSISGDEIGGMEDEAIFLGYLDEMDELIDDNMEEVTDQEEEDTDMEPPEDHSILVFNKHVGSVFCCDLHPTGKLAVTGGEDDKAFVWSVQTGQVLFECTGHKDSVIFVGFSFDGAYVATADMSGLIKVWKCNLEENQQEPWPLALEYEAEDLNFGLWHFGARVLVCGAVSGDIYVLKIPSGDIKVLQGHNTRVECAKVFSSSDMVVSHAELGGHGSPLFHNPLCFQMFKDGIRLAAGYDDGAVKVWDLKTNAVLHQIQANIHDMRVTAIDTHPENVIMASISSDGKVILATSNNGKVVGQLQAENDLETVAFAQDPELGLFALGTLNGEVSVWDTARQMVRHQCTKADDESIVGVTKMIWVKDHLVTGCLDGAIRVYLGRSGEKVLQLTGHRSEVLDMCFNEKENIILTTSDDSTARIYKYEINKDKD